MLNTKTAPGSDTRSERPDPADDTPGDEQPGSPAGKPADGGEGDDVQRRDAPKEQPGKPDAAADGKEKTTEVEDTVEAWKARHEDTEAKRRDIQSKYDKLVNEHGPEQTKQRLAALDGGWRGWIQRNAPEAYEKLQAHEKQQGQARDGEQATRAASERVILGVYRSGDAEFADYLTDLVESGARITAQSLDRHRETFTKYRGNGHANGSGNGAGDGAKPPKADTAPAAPPRVPGAGRPNVEAAPAWDGKSWSPRRYMDDGLKAGDARGRLPNPKRELMPGRR